MHWKICCILTVIPLILGSQGVCEMTETTVGNYTMRESENGALSLWYNGTAIVRDEQLLLEEKQAPGKKKTLFTYGMGDSTRTSTVSEKMISGHLPGIMEYRKRYSVTSKKCFWDITWKSRKRAETDCFYFINIPKETLEGAFYEARAGKGIQCGELTHSVPDFKGMDSITFITDSLEISFVLKARNVMWQIHDRTGMKENSYQLRIRTLASDENKKSVNVTVTVHTSTPEKVKAAKLKWLERIARHTSSLKKRDTMNSNKPLKIKGIQVNSNTPSQGDKFEITCSLEATYDNPYDPEDIKVDCEFGTPDGNNIIVPGFYYIPFENTSEGGIVRKGQPVWKIRYTPGESGRYRYRLKIRDRNGAIESPEHTIECLPKKDFAGFVRVSHTQPKALEFDSENPFIPLGINLYYSTRIGMPIPDERLEVCEKYINRLADNGGNFVRLRMDSWWNAIEMTPDPITGYLGIGWYHPLTCWELDRLYELAEERDIYIMHCFDNANASVNSNVWNDTRRGRYNLYLKENGGPCETPGEFWTSEEAIQYVRNKLRYCIARWGYSSNLMSWELWNEVVLDETNVDQVVSWHRNMAGYINKIDVNRHPVTSSLMHRNGHLHDRLWSIPEMEIAQMHAYRGDDLTLTMTELIKNAHAQWDKPFFIGEFGTKSFQGDAFYDPRGIHFHNGLWSSVAAGAAGGSALWWVENYIDKYNLYFHFQSVKDWVRDIPWNNPDIIPIRTSVPRNDDAIPVTPIITLSDSAAFQLWGRTNRTMLWLWIKNSQSSWFDLKEGVVITPIKNAYVTVSNIREGRYHIEWWDTWNGKVLKQEMLECEEGTIQIAIPPFTNDIAAKLKCIP